MNPIIGNRHSQLRGASHRSSRPAPLRLLANQNPPDQPIAEAGEAQDAHSVHAPRQRRFSLKRTRWRELSLARLMLGGQVLDAGRLGRYVLVVAAGLAGAWLPAAGYLLLAPKSYTSSFSLILPGAGSSASVNLADIGQASSAASSAYSSSSISPTVTYKNLIMSANVMGSAAALLKTESDNLPDPVVKLVDETSFIEVALTGSSPAEARDRAAAVMNAFFTELDKLRSDEMHRRESSITSTVGQYEQAVNEVRRKISELQVSSGISSIDQYNAMVASADTMEARVADAEAALAKTEEAIASLAANLHVTPALAASTLKLHADPQFAALSDSAAKEQAAYAELSKQFGSRHPKVVEARSRFDGAERMMMKRASAVTGLPAETLTSTIDLAPTGQRSPLLSQLVTLQTERDGLAVQLSAMRSELTESRKRIAQLVNVVAELDGLNRDYKVAEAVFASSLARINTSKTDVFASYPMVQITEAPVMPLKPSSPSKKIAIGAAAVATLLLMVTLLLAWIRRPLISRLLARKSNTDSTSS